MVRRMLIACAVVAMLCGSASQAWAQGTVPPGWTAQAGWNGSFTQSSHQDEGVFGLTMGFHPWHNGYFALGGQVRIGYEFDYGGVQKYLGTARYYNDVTLKWPYFVDITAGLEHFTGGSNFYLEPAVGVVFPWGFGNFKLYGQVGMPMHFYDNNTEIGFGGQVGLTFPLGRK